MDLNKLESSIIKLDKLLRKSADEPYAEADVYKLCAGLGVLFSQVQELIALQAYLSTIQDAGNLLLDTYKDRCAQCHVFIQSLKTELEPTKVGLFKRRSAFPIPTRRLNVILETLDQYAVALQVQGPSVGPPLLLPRSNGSTVDINKSVAIVQKAALLAPTNHPARSALLQRVVVEIAAKASHTRSLLDIDAGICASKEAMDATPYTNPSWIVYRRLAATLYDFRYDLAGDKTDLEMAMSAGQECLDHPLFDGVKHATVRRDVEHIRSRLLQAGNLATTHQGSPSLPNWRTAIYQTVQTEHVRLLRIKDRTPTTLDCVFDTVPLSSTPTYRALSYTWDTETSGKQTTAPMIITVNEVQIEAQQNLLNALTCIPFTIGDRLWIDFICINQADLAERNAQTRHMKRIYEQASRVDAWLGQPIDDEAAREAIKLMRKLALDTEPEVTGYSSAYQASYMTKDHRLNSRPGPENQLAWQGIADIFDRAYWTRTWVQQEATATLNIGFYYGTHHFAWLDFNGAVTRAQEYIDTGLLPQSLNRTIRKGGGIDQLLQTSLMRKFALSSADQIEAGSTRYKKIADKHVDDFLGNVAKLRNTFCKDPRDKVFAAMAHSSDTLTSGIDYSRDLVDVYKDVFEYSLRRYGSLMLLSHVVHSASAAEAKGCRALSEIYTPVMRSWIPDWRQQADIQPLGLFDSFFGDITAVYQVYKDKARPVRVRGNSLIVTHTHIFDKIQNLTTIWHDRDTEPAFAAVLDWEAELKNQGAKFTQQAWNRTLAADVSATLTGTDTILQRGGYIDLAFLSLPVGDLNIVERNKQALMQSTLMRACYGRRAGVTQNQRVGLFPAAAKKGDILVAFSGGAGVYVIRPHEGGGDAWRFVGECYVDGMMDGGIRGLGRKGVESREVVLV